MNVWVVNETWVSDYEAGAITRTVAVLASYKEVCTMVFNNFGEVGVDDYQCSEHMWSANDEAGYIVWKFDSTIVEAQKWVVGERV